MRKRGNRHWQAKAHARLADAICRHRETGSEVAWSDAFDALKDALFWDDIVRKETK